MIGTASSMSKDLVWTVAEIALLLMQVSASHASNGKAMPDLQADEYLKEWVYAEEVRERCIIPKRHCFRYTIHSKLASILVNRASVFDLLH